MRDDTAELASYALSDAISIRSLSPSRQSTSSATHASQLNSGSYFGKRPNLYQSARLEPHDPSRPGIIHEVSEPVSPAITETPRRSPPLSALSEMIRNSPPVDDQESIGTEEVKVGPVDTFVATIARGIISQPGEDTPLFAVQGIPSTKGTTAYNSIEDLEGQEDGLKPNPDGLSGAIVRTKEQGHRVLAWISNPQSWNPWAIWSYGVQQPLGYVPAVVLGLLLNVLDALSYGEYNTRFINGHGC